MKGQRESLISSQARLCDRKVPFWRGNKQRAVLEEREVENKDNVFKSTLTPAVCLFHRLCLFYRKTLRLLKGIRCVPLGPLFTEVKNNLVPHVSSTKAFLRSTAESMLYNWSKKRVQPWFHTGTNQNLPFYLRLSHCWHSCFSIWAFPKY